jgi:LDH2 family malate/lactate/ureidoglycolate dehydrogenase
VGIDLAIEKVKQSKMVCVGIKNIGMSGYIGDYAHMVTNHNCIFIGFNNSPKGLVPHGAKRGIWGTNPLTIGVPTHDIPVILDMASTQTTWGNLMLATSKGQSLEAGVAIDAEGSPTVDPSLAALGGLLPFAGPKGSGLGFIIELLAGALTGSRVGCSVPGEGGCFYIVIDPTLFRDLKEFKDDIQTAIKELKSTPRANGFHEIFYTGEQSQKRRLESLKVGSIIIDQEIYNSVLNFVEHNPKNI